MFLIEGVGKTAPIAAILTIAKAAKRGKAPTRNRALLFDVGHRDSFNGIMSLLSGRFGFEEFHYCHAKGSELENAD
jgi:hypothetical protein